MALLLELLWKPRRERKRAATLILAEVVLNTELLLLHAHARTSAPKHIPADLRMSTIGWDATSGIVSELPAKFIRKLVVLYNRYSSLDRQIVLFTAAVEARQGKSRIEASAPTLMAESTLHAFNSGVDVAIDHGQELLGELILLASWKESTAERAITVDFAKVAADHMKKLRDRESND